MIRLHLSTPSGGRHRVRRREVIGRDLQRLTRDRRSAAAVRCANREAPFPNDPGAATRPLERMRETGHSPIETIRTLRAVTEPVPAGSEAAKCEPACAVVANIARFTPYGDHTVKARETANPLAVGPNWGHSTLNPRPLSTPDRPGPRRPPSGMGPRSSKRRIVVREGQQL